jgi:acetyl-CoA C-acetyltransferase
MADAYIYDAVRTPRGKGKDSGSLYTVKPLDLLVTVLDALQERCGFAENTVEDVIVGCVTQVGDQGACIARTAVLRSGYGDTPPGQTVNRFCGSGLEAVNQGAALVASGFQELVVAGGVESMSRVKMGSDGGALFDAVMIQERGIIPQGISADLVATTRGFSRQDVDAFAAESQSRALAAIEAGSFSKSLIPVVDESGITILDHDEFPRAGTTVETLAGLNASFQMMGEMYGLDVVLRKAYPEVDKVNHVHHAGNSSGIVDGAAAVLLGSLAAGDTMGIKPRARIRSVAIVGDEPVIMLTGPMPASEKALAKAGMTIGDIDIFEVNEAFAAVPLAYAKHFDIDPAKINVHGGAIALGHPLGATGAMLLGTALDALEERDQQTALITLCIGGGMGIATIIERV